MSFKKHCENLERGFSSYRVPRSFTSLAIDKFLTSLDCPRSLSVYLLYNNQEFDQLVNLAVDPLHYNDANDFRDAYAATNLLSKFQDFSIPGLDRRKAALKKFFEFEELCNLTNNRFRNLNADPQFKGPAVWLHNAVTRKIQDILGPLDVGETLRCADWGPGATTLIKRSDSSAPAKFQHEVGITRDLYPLLSSQFFTDLSNLWGAQLGEKFPVLCVGNRVVTVPKNAKIDRVIAIEPGLNLWLQKGIGSVLRSKLGKCGVDLQHQSVNQLLAKRSSMDGTLATVDLSSASDSISRELVREILPSDWYLLMDSSRSHFGIIDGKPHLWSKFSSMGNGFTFELETLIFYAAAVACCEYLGADPDRVSVYGDDIIIPVECQYLFQLMMDFYGFRMNMEKSFFTSPFRESCGAHYFAGICCKPFFLKKTLRNALDLIKFHNGVRLFSHRQYDFACDRRFRSCCEFAISLIPKALRLRVPANLGDVGFISNFDESVPRRAKHQIEGFAVSTISESSRETSLEYQGVLLHYLWRLQIRSWSNRTAIVDLVERIRLCSLIGRSALGLVHQLDEAVERKAKNGNAFPVFGSMLLSVRTVIVRQWYDLGEWI